MRAFIASVGLCLISLVATTSIGFAQCSPDTESPTISNMPNDTTLTAEAGLCGATVSWTIPTAADNCELLTFTANQVPGDFYAVGITTVTYTAMDTEGNMAAASFTITITDDEDAAITDMPANINLSNDAGVCSAVATWDEPTATDNCGIATFTSTHDSGDAFAVGTTTVTYTATDVNGNVITDSFDVVVTDDEKPGISGMPADITQAADAGGCTAVVTWTPPTASDNCTVATFPGTHNPGDTFNTGTTTVSYTATDAAGNDSTATFTVTITDSEAPTITDMPANITQTADAGTCGAVVNWTEPTIADNCALAANGGDYASGDTFPVGTTTVTYTAADASGNNATAQTFTITVTDDEVPTFSGMPADINQDTDAGSCDAVVTWGAVTSADNCGVDTLYSSHDSGDTFSLGATTVTYTTIDIHGNTATASFTVTVADNENPSISGAPADITQTADAGVCSAAVTWTAPTDGDNCGSTLTSTHSPGDAFAVGTTTVTYTSTDAAGNTATASFNITITDDEDPAISGMPSNITQSTDLSNCTAAVSWTEPTAADNCAVDTFTSDVASGTAFSIGTTTVTYTATDIHGNDSTASFTVTVTDDEDPTVENLPANITQAADADSCNAAVTWTEPTAADN